MPLLNLRLWGVKGAMYKKIVKDMKIIPVNVFIDSLRYLYLGLLKSSRTKTRRLKNKNLKTEITDYRGAGNPATVSFVARL
jgi:hypothetical protein